MINIASENPLIRKLKSFGPWTASEIAILDSLSLNRKRVDAHQIIRQFCDFPDESYLVHRGWTCVYKLLSDGSRQVISFPLPGDIVGLPWLGFAGSCYWFESLTEAEFSPISTAKLLRDSAFEPKVSQAMRWSVALENAILIEHLVNVGLRSALVRTAHLLLELATRLRLIGEDTLRGFACPVNQYWLADALGVTAIHFNRVLRELREANLVTMRSGHVEIHDFAGLAELAAFDADYLTPPARHNQFARELD